MIRRLLSLPIEGEHTSIKAVDVLEDSGKCFFIADADIDSDGVGDDGLPNNPPQGDPWHDPYYQPDTAYHYNGKPLNAYKVPYSVVPKSIVNAVAPVVLGCKCVVTNRLTRKHVVTIIGDTGPTRKLGEISPKAANEIGVNPNPNTGGEDDYNSIIYEIYPGEQATIDGITYPLQAS